jgi:serine protease Do
MSSTSTLSAVGTEIGTVAERHGDSVVGVGRGWRVGSGVVVGPNRVLTAALHADAEGTTVTFADGRSERAQLAGVDPELGIAVLEVPTNGAEPLEWSAGADGLGIGAVVFALANPGGRGLRATAGFVSAAPRNFRGPRGRRLAGAIEHTAPLPRGAAGGPLLDSGGRLAGINLLRSEGGLILALGAGGGLRESAERLGRGEEVRRPTLGVAVAPPWVARKLRRAVGLPERDGLLVRGVEDGSPAGRAGVERGDLIVGAAGAEVDGIDALHRSLDEAAQSGALTLTVVRGAEERDIDVELEARAA